MQKLPLTFTCSSLECFKHLSGCLFETGYSSNAAAIHIQRSNCLNRDHSPPAAMVGRTLYRRPRTPGTPPYLCLGSTGGGGGYLPIAPPRFFFAARAQSHPLSAAGVRYQPGGHRGHSIRISPSDRRHSSLSTDLGAASGRSA